LEALLAGSRTGACEAIAGALLAFAIIKVVMLFT
jgi:hypothetical protein